MKPPPAMDGGPFFSSFPQKPSAYLHQYAKRQNKRAKHEMAEMHTHTWRKGALIRITREAVSARSRMGTCADVAGKADHN